MTTEQLWRGGQLQAQTTERDMRAMEALYRAQFHFSRDPRKLTEQLQEIDSQLLDLIIQQRGMVRIGGGYGSEMKITDAERLAEVFTARWQTYYDTQSKNAMQTWTDFGLGQSVNVVPRDTAAAEVWNEFWLARRNRPVLGERVLHEQSNEVVKSGELFYPMSTNAASGLAPGETTIRQILTEQIRSPIITLPDDPFINVWYIQNVNSIQQNGETYNGVAFRDWLATDEDVNEVGDIPDGTIDASELRPNTRVVMLYAARNRYLVDSTQYRGFPEFKQAYEWFRAYKDALGDILAKNRAVAMFVDKLNIKGGSWALGAIRTQLTSTLANGTDRLEQNPPPVPGSTWLQNEQADRTRMPLSTAAGDDRQSTMIVLGQGSAGTKVPLGWSGRPDAWQNRSVAEMTILPWNETMQRYQSWWASVFRDMAQIVLRDFEPDKREVDVTLDTLITVAITDLLAVIAGATDAAAKGIIDKETASNVIRQVARLALTKFGVVDVDEVLTPGEKPERKDDDDADDAMERLVHTAVENLREGADAQDVAEWALGELLGRFAE